MTEGTNRKGIWQPAAAAALLWAASCCATAAFPRVASVSACGDQYVLLLADRDQIAALSSDAVGPLAVYPDRAKGLPRDHGDLEGLLAANTDIVLLEGGGKPQLVGGLRRLGIRTVFLPAGNEISEIPATIRHVADALGQQARGAQLAADIARRIERLAADRAAEPERPIALFYRPDGGGGGTGTFINRLIELAGFRNLQAMAGQRGWRGIALEAAVQTPPQIFITGFFDTQQDSLIATRGRLPVLRADHVPIVALPGKDLVCGGPALVDGAERAAAARHRYFPGRSG